VLSLSFSAPLLAIEASTTAGSVAVWCDGALVAHEAVLMGAGPDDRLFPAIQRVLHAARLEPRALETVVCGAGPGSFTSLRIAAALAKGLARGSGAALFAVPSLLIAVASINPWPAEAIDGGLVVHADALRGERYVLPVRTDASGLVCAAGPLARVAGAVLAESVPSYRRVGVLTSPFADEVPTVTPGVQHLARAGGAWREQPVSLDAWEPEYGRLAEAQVKWEERFGMALPDMPAVRG
jgi:tRNA threonylcarbamoyladenosine biosynthesis protein TsaB